MAPMTRWSVAAGLLAALSLSACAQVSEATHKPIEPYEKEETDEKGLYRVKLTQSAADRLEIATSPVRRVQTPDGPRKVIPYAGLVYAPDGDTWTYTTSEPLTYLRVRVTVDRIQGNRVLLKRGPRVGTLVIVAGAAELYGIEFGLGK